MTETEKKIDDLLCENSYPWRSVRSSISKWHDSEMCKLKGRLIGVVQKHRSAFGTITYYDGGEIVASPNAMVAELVKEMEAVGAPKQAEPKESKTVKHSDMSELAQTVIAFFDDERGSDFLPARTAKSFELVADYIKIKVEQAVETALAAFFNSTSGVPASIVEDITQEVMPKVLPKDPPAEPLSPFGCKCWKDSPDGGWRHTKQETGMVNLLPAGYSFCPFCGKARVEKP